MAENIIISLISLVGTLGGSFGGVIISNRLTNYRVGQLEKKVEKHNNLIERTYKIEQNLKALEIREKVSEHRIEDLEKG